MATIAEILASRSAGVPPTPIATPEAPSTPGKPPEPAPPPRTLGLVLTNQPPETAMEPPPPEPRSLSRPHGEAIPLTPVTADQETATWHQALNAFESELCLMRDPQTPESAWLAVRPQRQGLPPILLYRLPWLLWDHPTEATPGPF